MNYRGHILSYQEQIIKPVGGIPLSPSHIYGVDTESFHSIELNDLHTAMVQTADHKSEYLDEPKLGESPFHYMIDRAFQVHAVEMTGKLAPSNTRMRREPKKRGAGRPMLPAVLFCFYNLEYDIQRLFLGNSDFFKIAKVNIEGMKILIDGYEIENVHMVLTGSAPHFSWIVRKDNRIMRLYAIDIWGYLKQGLAESAKALGVIDKIDIDKSYFHIPFEELSDEQLNELREYGKRDPKTTREIYLMLLEILSSFSPAVITKKGILPPSAPAAAARIAFSQMDGDYLRQSPKWAVELALSSYSGGLVFSRVRGAVSNILVGDRNSAYPTMMTLLPDPEKITYISRIKPNIDELIGKIGFCRASFVHHGKFIPFVTTWDGSARSNHGIGNYHKQAISIYELAAGYLTGQITDITVHEAVYLSYEKDAESSGFLYDFVMKYHKMKNENEKGSPLYLLAKLLMNSLYGKLIEMRSPETLILPKSVSMLRVPESWNYRIAKNDDFRNRFYTCLVQSGFGLDELLQEFPSFHEDSFVKLETLVESTELKAGTFFFPFYASLITAGQRAWMSVYTYFTKAFLADTDSAFTPLSLDEFKVSIQKADEITSLIGVGRCQIGNALGDIDIEIQDASGYIAGIKQYALKDKKGKEKIAHHAITSPDLSDTEHPKDMKNLFFAKVIEHLSKGESVTYQEKARPIKIRSALLRGGDYGKFFSSPRTITPKDDPRMKVLKRTKNLSFYQWLPKNGQNEPKLHNDSDFLFTF